MTATVLAAGRRAAQQQMVDTCTIRSLIRSTDLDDHTGEYTLVPDPDLPDPVYAGPCRFTAQQVQVRDVDSQGQDLAVADGILAIPVDAPGSVLVGKDHTAVVTLTRFDTAVLTAVIQAGHAQSYATARRFPVHITT